jgi:divalent metal cation (Fe/Co/Zn/Cd) transporter
MKFIKKLFIKNYTKTSDPTVRHRYGIVAGIFGTISNILLFIIKLLIAIPSNTITILVDAVNNLSDAGSSLVTLVGFKLSSKPSDKEHPFGYARYEHITGLILL